MKGIIRMILRRRSAWRGFEIQTLRRSVNASSENVDYYIECNRFDRFVHNLSWGA